MIRKAFVMSVNAGSEAEYARRHAPIWSELEAVLKAHGVHRYSIFLLDATGELFAYAEVESEPQWEAIAQTPECQRWWQYMRDLMPHNADGSPITEVCRKVFHLE